MSRKKKDLLLAAVSFLAVLIILGCCANFFLPDFTAGAVIFTP